MNKKKERQEDRVTRISKENFEKLIKLTTKAEKQKGKKMSLNQRLEFLFNTLEHLDMQTIRYATKLFDDLADARGAAIMDAVRTKSIPEMPYAVAVIEEDSFL